MEQPRISTSSLSPDWKIVPAGRKRQQSNYAQQTQAPGWPEVALFFSPLPPRLFCSRTAVLVTYTTTADSVAVHL